MTTMTTAELARHAADVALAVAALDRPGLPPLRTISTSPTSVWAHFPGLNEVEAVARWAQAHGQAVVLDLSSTYNGRLLVMIPAPFGHLEIQEPVSVRRIYELGAMLQIPVRDGDRVEVDASALLAALATESGTS